jgi:hypothetical protein
MTNPSPLDPCEALDQALEVVARYSTGETHGAGRIVAYYEQPTYVIERPDGTRFSWRADMTFAAPASTT